jgi:hypothetical protein
MMYILVTNLVSFFCLTSGSSFEDASTLLQFFSRSNRRAKGQANLDFLASGIRPLQKQALAAVCEGLPNATSCLQNDWIRKKISTNSAAAVEEAMASSPEIEAGSGEVVRGLVKKGIEVIASTPSSERDIANAGIKAIMKNGEEWLSKFPKAILDTISTSPELSPISLVERFQELISHGELGNGLVKVSEALAKASGTSFVAPAPDVEITDEIYNMYGKKEKIDSFFFGFAFHVGPMWALGMSAEFSLTFHFFTGTKVAQTPRVCFSTIGGWEPTLTRIDPPLYLGPGDPELIPVISIGMTDWNGTKTGAVWEVGGGFEVGPQFEFWKNKSLGIIQMVGGAKLASFQNGGVVKGWFIDMALPEFANICKVWHAGKKILSPMARHQVMAPYEEKMAGKEEEESDEKNFLEYFFPPPNISAGETQSDKNKFVHDLKFNVLALFTRAHSFCTKPKAIAAPTTTTAPATA